MLPVQLVIRERRAAGDDGAKNDYEISFYRKIIPFSLAGRAGWGVLFCGKGKQRARAALIRRRSLTSRSRAREL